MWIIALVAFGIIVVVVVIAAVIIYALLSRGSISAPTSYASSEIAAPKKLAPSALIPIGRTDSLCPYCGAEQKPRPKAKKKCRECGGFIYVRKRPLDEQRVLLKDTDLEQLDEQKAIAGGYHAEFLKQKEKNDAAKRLLGEKLGRPPDEVEIAIVVQSEDMDEYIKQGNYGMFRNALYDLANALDTKGHYLQALKAYLQLYYVDYNGPGNIGSGADSVRKLYAWRPSDSGVLPPSDAVRSIVELNLGESEVKRLFISEAAAIKERLGTPLAPEEVWSKFSRRLFDWVAEERND